MFQLGRWQVVQSYSSRLLVDQKQKMLWRFGWGDMKKNVRRNYEWLQRVHALIPTPAPRFIRTYGPLLVTSESYVPGKPLAPADITPARIADIVQVLVPLYKTGFIHGDLTHRNILSGSDGLYFIDGDRSIKGPPEFDVWLLVADAYAHRGGGSSHREFLQFLWGTDAAKEPFASATALLYEKLPGRTYNPVELPRLWSAFLGRCLVHSVRDCVRRGKSLDFLDDLTHP